MDLSEKLHRSVKIDTWISLSSLMNLSMDLIKLLHGFVKVVLLFCSKLLLNESKHSMPWVCCAFGNVLSSNTGTVDPNVTCLPRLSSSDSLSPLGIGACLNFSDVEKQLTISKENVSTSNLL